MNDTENGQNEKKMAKSGNKLVIVESPAKAKTIGKYLGDDFVVMASVGQDTSDERIAEVRASRPWVACVVLSNHRSPELAVSDAHLLPSDVVYLVKSTVRSVDQILDAVHAAMTGTAIETPDPDDDPVIIINAAQAQVLRMLAAGATTRALAEARGTSVRAAESLLVRLSQPDAIEKFVAASGGYDIPAYIHSEDRRFIADPSGIHGEAFTAQLAEMTFAEPREVRELKNNSVLDLLGMKITAIHAPGHTRGSLMFTINDEILISGDVLFAGSIGRTDLPTGSAKEMMQTLKTKVLPLSDDLRVLTGHGPETTIKFERKNNPYLKELTS